MQGKEANGGFLTLAALGAYTYNLCAVVCKGVCGGESGVLVFVVLVVVRVVFGVVRKC